MQGTIPFTMIDGFPCLLTTKPDTFSNSQASASVLEYYYTCADTSSTHESVSSSKELSCGWLLYGYIQNKAASANLTLESTSSSGLVQNVRARSIRRNTVPGHLYPLEIIHLPDMVLAT